MDYNKLLKKHFKNYKPTKQDLQKLLLACVFVQDWKKYKDFTFLLKYYDKFKTETIGKNEL